eukprot:g5253.t1
MNGCVQKKGDGKPNPVENSWVCIGIGCFELYILWIEFFLIKAFERWIYRSLVVGIRGGGGGAAAAEGHTTIVWWPIFKCALTLWYFVLRYAWHFNYSSTGEFCQALIWGQRSETRKEERLFLRISAGSSARSSDNASSAFWSVLSCLVLYQLCTSFVAHSIVDFTGACTSTNVYRINAQSFEWYVASPLTEELVFRVIAFHVLYNRISQMYSYDTTRAIDICAFASTTLFSLSHLVTNIALRSHGGGEDDSRRIAYVLLQVVAGFFGGLFFQYSYVRPSTHPRILPPILLHVVNNLCAALWFEAMVTTTEARENSSRSNSDTACDENVLRWNVLHCIVFFVLAATIARSASTRRRGAVRAKPADETHARESTAMNKKDR